jgi:beta-phosphoglucomutase family hydrolase
MTRRLDEYAAVLFDLDGVLTPTAEVHRVAWKRTFDRFLMSHFGDGYRPFTLDDYLTYVDGKPRYDGVHSFLASRGVTLPSGHPSEPPSLLTEAGVGNLKNDEFTAVLEGEGVTPYPGSVALLEHLEQAGVAVAVVSSSANAISVLEAAGLRARFEVVVDGLTAHERGLAGKPSPATFLSAAGDLGVDPSDSVVVEDAISGIEAGAAGGFGLVVGVDRENQADAMRRAGAHLVVADLGELVPGA